MAGSQTKIIILGAAGRDFHDFNVLYRDDPATHVIAFTATQIPGIAGRRYPMALAGPRYPQGIPIVDEGTLENLCRAIAIDRVVFAYSDVPHEYVMHLASRALALGADFVLPGPSSTMLASALPVIAIGAVRTGCGKSSVAQWLARRLRGRGMRVAVIRHPMPYGDLAAQRVQRFATTADLDAASCTLEEREEYEPHLAVGNVVFAGVDYADILRAAEAEADIIVWEGGNNDFPFIKPDLFIALADALRPMQVASHHPGEAVVRMADVLVINKVDAAPAIDVAALAERLRTINRAAPIVRGASPVTLDDASGDRRAAGAGDRGRPDHDPWRPAVRRRLRRRPRRRRAGAGGSARRRHPGVAACVRTLPPHRPGAAGDGLRRRATFGVAGDHRGGRRRRGGVGDPGRSRPADPGRQEAGARPLRVRRNR